MGFTLYNQETGARYYYDNNHDNRVSFGRRDLERALSPKQETIPLDVAGNLTYVSIKHIRILKRKRTEEINYEIMDLSKNGTCVNGRRIQGGIADLKHGDLIRLGPEDMDSAYAVYFLEDGKTETFKNSKNKRNRTNDLTKINDDKREK